MILRLAGGQEVDYRALTLLDLPRYGVTTGLRGYTGGTKAASAVPAFNRAARIRSEAIASLTIGMYRGQGYQKTEAARAWQKDLFARQRMNEYQTRFAFWDAAEESLSYRGNAYLWKLVDPQTGRVPAMYALHPDQVTCKDGTYTVTVREGYIDPVGKGNGRYTVSDQTILHIRGHGDGGADEAPSPVQVFAETINAQLSRQRHESKMWEKGTSLQLGVEFPEGTTPEKAGLWRDKFDARYAGPDGGTTAVVGGGAKFVPIGMTMQDAQFVQMANLTAEDAARIMGVPYNLLRPPTRETVGTFEQDLAYWLRFGIGPELYRIESALTADHDICPDGSDIHPLFETENFVRGDLLTEDTVDHQRVQDGRLLVDEWRQSQGLPPLPNGMGMIPQIVPVGGGPNPALTKTPGPQAAAE